MVDALKTLSNICPTPRGQLRPKTMLFRPSNLVEMMNIPVVPAITDLQYKTLANPNIETSHISIT